jgi:L-lactate utilization protein LutC
MVFASRVQKTVEIPHDPPHTALLQKLPRRHLITASKQQTATLMSDIRAQFGERWQQEIAGFTSKKSDDAAALTKAAKDPLLQFDVDTLLQYGLKAWTYDEPLTPDALADLDQETAEHLAREILRLTAPKLFDLEEGDDRKNGSASSGPA